MELKAQNPHSDPLRSPRKWEGVSHVTVLPVPRVGRHLYYQIHGTQQLRKPYKQTMHLIMLLSQAQALLFAKSSQITVS